jgi:hypothetical protein
MIAAAPPPKPVTVQQKMVTYALREARRNVQEIPARSNLGPDIRRYHSAVTHASDAYPWCTIFVSYIAKRAGYPLGSVAQGIAQVPTLFRWGRKQGFYFAKGTRRVKVGDIAVHGYGHAGIVVRITKQRRIYTVDGNWGNTVRYQPIPFLSVDGYIRLPSTPRG